MQNKPEQIVKETTFKKRGKTKGTIEIQRVKCIYCKKPKELNKPCKNPNCTGKQKTEEI